jgi:hypothetical protein
MTARGAEQALEFLRREITIAEELAARTKGPERTIAHSVFDERRFLLQVLQMVIEKLLEDEPPRRLN